MEIDVTAGEPGEVEAQALAFAVADAEELPPAATALDGPLGGRLGRLAASGDLRGDAGAACVVYANGEIAADRVVAIGLGKAKDDPDSIRTAAAAAARTLSRVGGTLAWALDPSLPLSL